MFVLILKGRAVQTALSLDEGLREVKSLQMSEVRPENHDKLVHLMGELKTDKVSLCYVLHVILTPQH